MLIAECSLCCKAYWKTPSHIIKRYRCYIQCLPALSPLSLLLVFKEDLTLKKILYSRVTYRETRSHHTPTQFNLHEN